MVVELIKLGITPEELFGEEISEILKAYYLNADNPQLPKEFDNDDFREGVSKCVRPPIKERPLTKDEIVAMILEMKSRGDI